MPMLKLFCLTLIAIVLLVSNASAWEIKEVTYNTTTKELEITFILNPLEKILSFFIGGDLVKTIVENLVYGNYTLVSAGYDDAKIRLNGTVYFSEEVSVVLKMGNETEIILNTTLLNPEIYE